jgi:prepilin-type processing-associated H-X9-DG protein
MSSRCIFRITLLAAIGLAFATSLSSASVRTKAQQARDASNLRQVVLAFHVYTTSGARVRYNPDTLQDMESILQMFVQAELFDAPVYLTEYDLKYAKSKPPKITGSRNEDGEVIFQPDILNFPIFFSFAVYPDLGGDRPASMTPLLWTRGLHRYESFEEPYGGHVAYLDGHVRYFEGEPGKHDPELERIFGEDSVSSKTVRIVEHEPEEWSKDPVKPLPIRYKEALSTKYSEVGRMLRITCLPALVAAILVGLVPKPSIGKRILDASIAFGIVLIVTLIFFPAFC